MTAFIFLIGNGKSRGYAYLGNRAVKLAVRITRESKSDREYQPAGDNAGKGHK